MLFKAKLTVMKKFSTISGALLSAVMVIVVFAACQKEQAPVSQETAAVPSDETRIVGVAGSQGQGVSPTYAAALAANYADKYNDNGRQSQYVVFDAAALSKFITNLQTKYGSTKIYVNFGVYGKGAQALNSKNNGKLTVFFTGDKIPTPSSRRSTNGLLDDVLDEFLNHGEIFP